MPPQNKDMNATATAASLLVGPSNGHRGFHYAEGESYDDVELAHGYYSDNHQHRHEGKNQDSPIAEDIPPASMYSGQSLHHINHHYQPSYHTNSQEMSSPTRRGETINASSESGSLLLHYSNGTPLKGSSSNASNSGTPASGQQSPSTPFPGGLRQFALLSTRVSSGNLKAITACAIYSFCSVSMILVNKSLASR
jgi:hypothetical protein